MPVSIKMILSSIAMLVVSMSGSVARQEVQNPQAPLVSKRQVIITSIAKQQPRRLTEPRAYTWAEIEATRAFERMGWK